MFTQTLSPIQKIASNNRYSAKLSWKRKECLELTQKIWEYLADNKIFLPPYLSDFKGKEQRVLTDKETGECFYEDYLEMAKMYYELKKCNKAVYARFEHQGLAKQQILCCWYSKHRLDIVWNWRKSRLIRKLWRDFLVETSFHKLYKPMHLVLTVPHKNGLWKDKRYYAHELIDSFNLLRKSSAWKKYIYGGEYGVEISRTSDANGLHIHIHSLVFQYPTFSVNEVRASILREWKAITGADYIHYESLFVHKKDEKGKWIMNLVAAQEMVTDTEEFIVTPERLVRKKFYLDNSADWYNKLSGEEQLESYVAGVLECIKYHFKSDSFKDKNEEWDMDLIKEVLNNSKGLRMYSKFGAFYKETKLNYLSLEKKPAKEDAEGEQEATPDLESESLNGNVEGVEENIMNPFTQEPAKKGEYIRCISIPELIRHRPKNELEPYQPLCNDRSVYYKINDALSLKEVMRALALSQYRVVLDYEDYERFRNDFLKISNCRH